MTIRSTDNGSSELFTYEADEVGDVIASLPGKDRKISLYRLNPQGRSSYIAEFFPEEFSQAYIQDNYGGGKFSISAETNDGIKKMRFDIEGEPKIKGLQRQVRKDIPGIGTVVMSVTEKEAAERYFMNEGNPKGSINPDPMIQMLIAQNQRLEAKIDSLQNANHGGGGGSSRREFYEEMALLKGLFATQQPQSDQAQLTEMFKKGLEIAGQAFGGEVGTPASPWLSIVEKAIPILTQAFTQVAAQAQRNPIQMNAANNLNPLAAGINGENKTLPPASFSDMLPGVSEQAKITPTLISNNILENLRPFLPQLMRSAAGNTDPAPWAEIIAGQVSEQEKGAVIEWLAKDGGNKCLKDLIAMEPAISLQTSWWADLQSALYEILTGTGESDNGEEKRTE